MNFLCITELSCYSQTATHCVSLLWDDTGGEQLVIATLNFIDIMRCLRFPANATFNMLE